MSTADSKHVMIIAGEASGDQHGAKVVTALKVRYPDLVFTGIGGSAMQSAGVHILVDAHRLAVVGITEVFSKGASLLKGLFTAKKALKRLHPDLLILIDFPDFNLHVAATAKKIGIPILYYISPQIWAWRERRAEKIGRRVDHMAVILPFEADFYRRFRVPVTFVGHPLLDINPEASPEVVAQPDPHQPVIGFLPGSREKEVARLLPEMIKAAAILKRKRPVTKFLLSLAPSVKPELVKTILSTHEEGIDFETITDGVQHVFRQSTLVVAASGTVTLEAAIAGVPMVIVYKVSPVSYRLGRALIRVEHIGLANLIAGREIVPELIQKQASPENIADTVCRMLDNPARLNQCKNDLLKLRHDLGGPGASVRVADIATRMLEKV